VELDNGALLTAPAERFEECFTAVKRRDPEKPGSQTFSTTGVIVDQRLRTSK
jgi:hypothetical protein